MSLKNVQAVDQNILVLDLIHNLFALYKSCEEDYFEHFLWAISCVIKIPNTVHNSIFYWVYYWI